MRHLQKEDQGSRQRDYCRIRLASVLTLFEAQSPGPPISLSTLQATPRDLACKTRGQDGFAALLSCRALSSPTTCRFIPALSGLPVIREGRWWHISSSLLESHSPMAGLRSAKSPHTYLLLPLRNIHALHKKPKAE